MCQITQKTFSLQLSLASTIKISRSSWSKNCRSWSLDSHLPKLKTTLLVTLRRKTFTLPSALKPSGEVLKRTLYRMPCHQHKKSKSPTCPTRTVPQLMSIRNSKWLKPSAPSWKCPKFTWKRWSHLRVSWTAKTAQSTSACPKPCLKLSKTCWTRLGNKMSRCSSTCTKWNCIEARSHQHLLIKFSGRKIRRRTRQKNLTFLIIDQFLISTMGK